MATRHNTVDLEIERIGADGDGAATLPDGTRFYVPQALPGEMVRIERSSGTPVTAGSGPAILRPSPDRIAPACPHFGECGGCTLQHWRDGAYAAWKSNLLREALHRAGYPNAPVAALARSAPAQRRRLDFAAIRTQAGVTIGLHARNPFPAPAARHRGTVRAPHIANLSECAVLHPALLALIAPLRSALAGLRALRREASIVANLLDRGPDLLLRTDSPLDGGDRARLIRFARDHHLVRISWAAGQTEPEPILILQPPRMTLSAIPVDLPPGGFLQATAAGEAAIIDAALAGLPPLPPRTRIAELYAGSGTLTFALAQRGRLSAWEGDAAAAAALRQAANRAGLSGRIEVIQRDLVRQPLSARELQGFAAAILDPPFAGAAAQTAQIAAAKIPRVVYISCNPAVLARDARTLHEAGYQLLDATPVDQFLWSARLESVCTFSQ